MLLLLLLLLLKQFSTDKISVIRHAYPDIDFLAFPVGSYKNQLLYHILTPIFFFSIKCEHHQGFGVNLARISFVFCFFYNPENPIRRPSEHGLVPLLQIATPSCSTHLRLLPSRLSANVIMARMTRWAQGQNRLLLASLTSIWD